MTNKKELDIDIAMLLNVIDLCKDMRTMPLPGGLFDQDSLFIHLYEHVADCRNTRQELDNRKQTANSHLPPPRGRR